MRRFTEKPDAETAAEFLKAGNYFWNSGMFLWSARTLADALREHLPESPSLLEQIAASFGTRRSPQYSTSLSQVRKHQHRLCGSRAAFRQRRACFSHLLYSRRVWLERLGILDRSA